MRHYEVGGGDLLQRSPLMARLPAARLAGLAARTTFKPSLDGGLPLFELSLFS